MGIYFWDSERDAVQALANAYKKYMVVPPHEDS